MKLRANQLPAHIQQCQQKQQWQPLYLLSGDEPLLMQEAADAMRAGARDSGFNERAVFYVDPQLQWDEVLENANSLSLFGDRKLLELRFSKAKFDDKAKRALTQLLESPNPDTLVLLLLPKLDKRNMSSQWFKTLEAQSALCQIWPIDRKQLPRWIHERLQQAGYQPDRDVAELLADRVQGNLLAAAQEIDKLTLLLDPGPLHSDAVAHCVMDQSRYTVFELMDAAVQGNLSEALRMLHYLRSSGTEPTLILWALTKELRTLAAIHHQLSRGMSAGKAFRDQRVWDNRQPLVRRALERLSKPDCLHLLQQANHADACIKGQAPDNPWQQFEQILVQMSGKKRAIGAPI